ncbi:MAG: hypothetical protein ABIT36_06995 [Steroidobacteraceae bacterium]
MRTLMTISAAALLLAVSGCGGAGSDTPAPAPTTPTPSNPQPLQFTSFVSSQFAQSATGETQTSVEVETTPFTFTDEDPTAFDVVIAAAR